MAHEATLASQIINCIICDHAGTRSSYEVLTATCQFNGGRLERYRCPFCDCVFGAEKFLRIDDAMLDLDYRLLYSRYAEGNTTENEVRAFRSLNPQKGPLYINWGSGAWNTTVKDLRDEGYNIWGFEPSAEAPDEYTVRNTIEMTQTIEGIFSNNVIEHFRDPVKQFLDFSALLAPGTRMAHASPCYEYLYEYTRFHTVFLLGRSPEVLASRTGFRVVDFVNDGPYKNCIFEKLR
ncbi:MAG: methyltransferase [Mesorhizobium sp.]|nr:MAG: methyltransferase [Mesorhizobium sp.]